jgi:hypothetical protein
MFTKGSPNFNSFSSRLNTSGCASPNAYNAAATFAASSTVSGSPGKKMNQFFTPHHNTTLEQPSVSKDRESISHISFPMLKRVSNYTLPKKYLKLL